MHFFQWYRSKHIYRLLKQHKDLQTFPAWTTKEIVVFARKFGYTPTFTGNWSIKSEVKVKPATQNNLSSIIKKQIKRERLKTDTLSFSNRITDWISNCSNLEKGIMSDVGNVDDDDIICVDDIPECRKQIKLEPDLVASSKTTAADVNKQWMPIEASISKEITWVTDVCREIEINLHPEEIVKGTCLHIVNNQTYFFNVIILISLDVMHSTSHRLVLQATRRFLEDLLRRAYSLKGETDSTR